MREQIARVREAATADEQEEIGEGPSVTEEEIDGWEQELGARFSPSYRRFLTSVGRVNWFDNTTTTLPSKIVAESLGFTKMLPRYGRKTQDGWRELHEGKAVGVIIGTYDWGSVGYWVLLADPQHAAPKERREGRIMFFWRDEPELELVGNTADEWFRAMADMTIQGLEDRR